MKWVIFRVSAEAKSTCIFKRKQGLREGSERTAWLTAAGLQAKPPQLSPDAGKVRLMAAVFWHLCRLRGASVRVEAWCHLRCAVALWMATNPIISFWYMTYCWIITNKMWPSCRTMRWLKWFSLRLDRSLPEVHRQGVELTTFEMPKCEVTKVKLLLNFCTGEKCNQHSKCFYCNSDQFRINIWILPKCIFINGI